MNRKQFLQGVFLNGIFLFLFFAVFSMQVIKGALFRKISDKNCIRLISQQGSRGRIIDRNGQIIAGNQISYDVMIVTQQGQSEELEKVFKKVSEVLAISLEEIKNRFRRGYVEPSLPVVVAQDIDRKNAIILEEIKSEIGHIIVSPRPVRHYAYGSLACHLLGYVHEIDHWRLAKLQEYGYKSKDIVGFGGVEERYDYYLRQQEGGLSVEVDHRGRFVRVLGFRPPRHGTDIQLTIDMRIQRISEEVLAQRNGAIIIMDPHTGEIIALASAPGFQPQAFVGKSSVYLQRLFEDSDAPFVNRAITGTYPPGSVFKLAVAAAALEQKKIDLSTTIDCPGYLKVGKQRFGCWMTHYNENLIDAISHSCNVFFYRIGIFLGGQLIHEYASKLGFGKASAIDLPYEESGLVPSPLWKQVYRLKTWRDGDTANFSIGQGELLVTPMQIARMMAVFANKGKLVTPYVVRAIGGESVESAKKKAVPINFRPTTISYIRDGIRKVVASPTGTASILNGLAVSVAGKTGTAQAPPGAPHAWFTGFFPYKNPRYVICVFVERGGAGYLSAMLAKQIIIKMAEEGLLKEDL